jgi:hypothetical protein
MADKKITELDENTAPLTTDLLAIVDDPGDTPATQKVTVGNVVSQLSAGADGWTASTDTWTYASASTFTIAGVDRTATYTAGTRLKFTQTTDKYAVVTGSSFSTNTTVTIAVNDDYTIANAAITAPYYSYAANPQGYPGWFDFTPTWGNITKGNGISNGRFHIIDRTIQIEARIVLGSTSSVTGVVSLTTPVTENMAPYYRPIGFAVLDDDNGNAYLGSVRGADTTTLLVETTNIAGTFPTFDAVDATTPFTWTTSDSISVHCEYQID